MIEKRSNGMQDIHVISDRGYQTYNSESDLQINALIHVVSSFGGGENWSRPFLLSGPFSRPKSKSFRYSSSSRPFSCEGQELWTREANLALSYLRSWLEKTLVQMTKSKRFWD